jgi:hypothetical protein
MRGHKVSRTDVASLPHRRPAFGAGFGVVSRRTVMSGRVSWVVQRRRLDAAAAGRKPFTARWASTVSRLSSVMTVVPRVRAGRTRVSAFRRRRRGREPVSWGCCRG